MVALLDANENVGASFWDLFFTFFTHPIHIGLIHMSSEMDVSLIEVES